MGLSETTFYKWKKKYGGMQVAEAKRLRALEDENRRLKQLVGDLSLDNAMLKTALEKMVSPTIDAPRSRPFSGSTIGVCVASAARSAFIELSYATARGGRRRTYRLYKLAGLEVRRRKRKRLASTRRPMLPLTTRPNERWSMDPCSMRYASGRRLRTLNVIDNATRECLSPIEVTSEEGSPLMDVS